MRVFAALLFLLTLAASALSQGLPFPGPGDRTHAGGGGGFTNAKSITMGTHAGGSETDRTQGTGASLRKMTFNFWFRTPSSFGTDYSITTAANNPDQIYVAGGNTVAVTFGGGGDGFVVNAIGLASTSTWYQITVQIDTANATAGNRIKIFVNGTLDVTTAVTPTQNYDTGWGNNGEIEVLFGGGTATAVLVDELSKIDNQLLAASSFATSNLPIDISALTFGAQGYWYRFETGVAATVGTDSSGNGLTATNNGFVAGDFSSTVP